MLAEPGRLPERSQKPGASAQTLCDAHTRGSSAVLKLVQTIAAHQKLTAAEHCLKIALASEPKDRDLAFALARVVAWQGRISEAKALASPWYSGDAESAELKATLARYEQGQLDEQAARSSPKAKSEQLGEAKPDGAADDDELDEGPRSLVGISVSRYFQSQGQATSEQRAYGFWLTPHWRYGLDLLAAERTYPPNVTLRDHTVTASVARLRENGGETELSFAYTPSSTFSYERMVELRHEVKTSASTYAGAEVRWAAYPSATSLLFAAYAGLYRGRYHSAVTLYDSFDGFGDLSALAEVDAQFGRWLPELFLAGGRGDASRPYLANSAHASFRLIGAKLAVATGDHLQPYLAASWRTEPKFFERMIEGGVEWKF